MIDKYTTSRGTVTLTDEQYNSILSRLNSLEAAVSTNLKKITLWEGDVSAVGATMTLSDSIENYRYILIKYRWDDGHTTSKELRWLDVDDVKSAGYYPTPSYVKSHILITPYDTYYVYLSFTANNSVAIPAANPAALTHIVGIYGIK